MEKYSELEMRAQAKYDNSFNHTLHAHIDIAGGLVAGTLLSQILYWFAPSRDGGRKVKIQHKGHFWLAKERTEWYEEIRISPKQFDRAVKELESRKLIKKGIFKFRNKTTIHVRPNSEEINTAIENWKAEIINKMTQDNEPEALPDMGFTQRGNLELPKGEIENYPKGKSRITQKGIPSIQRLHTEITNKDYINKQQQELEKRKNQIDENLVVVVREKYDSLFQDQKKLTKKQAEDLISLSATHEVDVLHKIENTYEIHIVSPRKNVIASIKYAIKNVDWEIVEVQAKEVYISPSVQREIDRDKREAEKEEYFIIGDCVEQTEEEVQEKPLSEEEIQEIRDNLEYWQDMKKCEIELYGRESERTIVAIKELEERLPKRQLKAM